MRELEYPFDGKFIVGKKLKLCKQLKTDNTKRIQKKIAILGGSTINDIKLCDYTASPNHLEVETFFWTSDHS